MGISLNDDESIVTEALEFSSSTDVPSPSIVPKKSRWDRSDGVEKKFPRFTPVPPNAALYLIVLPVRSNPPFTETLPAAIEASAVT